MPVLPCREGLALLFQPADDRGYTVAINAWILRMRIDFPPERTAHSNLENCHHNQRRPRLVGLGSARGLAWSRAPSLGCGNIFDFYGPRKFGQRVSR